MNKMGIVLRKLHGRFDACFAGSGRPAMFAAPRPSFGAGVGVFAAVVLPLLMLLAVLATVLSHFLGAPVLHLAHAAPHTMLGLAVVGQTADVKELGAELKSTFEQFKAVVAQEEAERKKLGEATSETKAIAEKMNERMDALEVRMQRSSITPQSSGAQGFKSSPKWQAFEKALRRGTNALTAEERGFLSNAEGKSMSLGNDTTGGYLAVTEFVKEIIKAVVEFSPVRELARVRPTSNRSSQIPKRTGTFAAQWVAEQGARTETTGLSYGREEIPNHEMFALVDISQQDLEDSEFDLASELNSEFSEQFGVAEGAGFVNGNAVGKPEGLQTAAGLNTAVSGDANLIKAEGLIDMVYNTKDSYAKNGSFLLRRSTIGAIRKLKDVTSGQFLWQPGLNGPTSNTILGYPYREAIDMPAIAANAYPVIFGDFKRGYVISDRIQIAVVRDDLTQATSGNVRFIARKRVGGQVVLGEALTKLQIHT